MNAVIRFMIVSDIVWVSSTALLGPIFALFIADFIEGGNAAVAGIAASVYLITKSVVQIPAASIIDAIRGEKDDFWIMVIGSFAAALVPLLYLAITTPIQLYIVQFIYGVIIAFTFPSYMAIFTRHIDKNKEGTEWGIYFTLTDFGSAIAASIGGLLVAAIGFKALIVVMVATSILSVVFLIPLRGHMRLASASTSG